MADIYIAADTAYSNEGLEGILGYQLYKAFTSANAAKKWLQDDVLSRQGNKPGLEFKWHTHEDDKDVEILNYSYLVERHVSPGVIRTSAGIYVQNPNVELVREQAHEERAVIKIELANVVDFIELTGVTNG